MVMLAGAGQLPSGVELVQLTAVQLKPAATGSLSSAPSAALGPVLVMVNV